MYQDGNELDITKYRVSKIQVNKFRGIENETFEFNKNLTIIVGENGTCKTTILIAIQRSLDSLCYENPINTEIINTKITLNKPAIWSDRKVESEAEKIASDTIEKTRKNNPGTTEEEMKNFPFGIYYKKCWEIFEEQQTEPRKEFKKFHISPQDLPSTLQIVESEPEDKKIENPRSVNWKQCFRPGTRLVECLLFMPWASGVETASGASLLDPKRLSVIYTNEKERGEKNLEKLNSAINELEWLKEIVGQLRIPTEEEVNKYNNVLNSDRGEAVWRLRNLISKNCELPLYELGSGVHVAVLIVWHSMVPEDNDDNRSVIFLIDEPEVHLHPRFQIELSKALLELSKTHQVIMTTHSPFMFQEIMQDKNVGLILLKKDKEGKLQQTNPGKKGIFGGDMSYAEINYRIYGLPTTDFFNELYGYLQEKKKQYTVKVFDESFLKKEKFNKEFKNLHECMCILKPSDEGKPGEKVRVYELATKDWIRENKKENETLTTISYIRSAIHHPENKKNKKYTKEELEASIQIMIELCKRAQETEGGNK